MPNNITNKVILHGDKEQIQELLEYVKCDDEEIGVVDFNMKNLSKQYFGAFTY